MRTFKVTIDGTFASLNEYIRASKTFGKGSGKWNAGNEMKQRDMETIASCCMELPKMKGSIYIGYDFYEPNRKRDLDNISGYFHKIFQDALVNAGIIQGDGWNNIAGFEDHFFIDRKNPRIEISILDEG